MKIVLSPLTSTLVTRMPATGTLTWGTPGPSTIPLSLGTTPGLGSRFLRIKVTPAE